MQLQWRAIVLSILSLSAFSLLATIPVSPVHAAGLLYLTPSSLQTAPSGSTLTVQVQVANLDPFTGWDIEVRTDQSILNPKSVSIDGNLLAVNFSATLLTASDCVNGQGTGCGTQDGFGVVHSAIVALGSNSVPPGPTSGLLFTITYEALNGSGGVSLIEFIRQVLINGVTASIVPVDAVNGFYGSARDFGIVLNPPFGSVTQGGELPVNATVMSFNGFTGRVNLTSDSLLSSYNLPATVFLDPDGSANARLFMSTTLCDPPSVYGLNLIGTSGNVSHTVVAFPSVLPNTSNKPDYCLIQLERFVSLTAGSFTTIGFQLASANQFNGTVSMTVDIIPRLPNGPEVSLLTPTVSMYPGGRGFDQIDVSTRPETPTGTYTIVVNATSGNQNHFLTEDLTIKPPQPTFSINATSTLLTLAPGSNTTDTITLHSFAGFNAPVALGTTIQPFIMSGPSVSLSLYTFQLSGTTNSTLTISAPRDASTGSYNVTIFANGGGGSASIVVTVLLVPLNPPFFTQFQWLRRVSIAHDNGTQSFVMGVRNANKGTSLFLSVYVTCIDTSGTDVLTLATPVIQLGPSQTLTNVELTNTFSASEVGATFHFSATIFWSFSSANLSITGSSRPGAPLSGSFIIVT